MMLGRWHLPEMNIFMAEEPRVAFRYGTVAWLHKLNTTPQARQQNLGLGKASFMSNKC